ncbi:hypothetical protein PM082_015240 [Marasmius tenuissimus]|nr:hypothetical protein PM082_015240 [Marasmius tenuissimus]
MWILSPNVDPLVLQLPGLNTYLSPSFLPTPLSPTRDSPETICSLVYDHRIEKRRNRSLVGGNHVFATYRHQPPYRYRRLHLRDRIHSLQVGIPKLELEWGVANLEDSGVGSVAEAGLIGKKDWVGVLWESDSAPAPPAFVPASTEISTMPAITRDGR